MYEYMYWGPLVCTMYEGVCRSELFLCYLGCTYTDLQKIWNKIQFPSVVLKLMVIYSARKDTTI